MTIIIVGFRLTQKRSVFYKSVTGVLDDPDVRALIFNYIIQAIKRSDFISVRVVR